MGIFNSLREAALTASSSAHQQGATDFSPSPDCLQPSGAEKNRSSSWKQISTRDLGLLLF